jgi:protein-S-isoprenylcysteine O-methyltransferase Ste14
MPEQGAIPVLSTGTARVTITTRIEDPMKTRAIVGVVLCLIGLLWIAQGAGMAKGSAMSGHSQYAVLGAVVVVAGVALLLWARRISKNRH